MVRWLEVLRKVGFRYRFESGLQRHTSPALLARLTDGIEPMASRTIPDFHVDLVVQSETFLPELSQESLIGPARQTSAECECETDREAAGDDFFPRHINTPNGLPMINRVSPRLHC